MDINIGNTLPSLQQKMSIQKDSLKLADIQKNFKIIDEVPSTDTINVDDDPQYSSQINNIYSTMKALQIAKKSLSDTQSIVKDIKSNYKIEKYDAWAPVDDTMLKQRYDLTLQIKKILSNAVYNHKNVFTADYSQEGIKLNLERKDLNSLNLRDEHSIDIFSYNIDKLSQQIEEEIKKLQDKIDKINQDRWLSMAKLSDIKLQPKEVNANLKNTQQTPNLATMLAQATQQTQDIDKNNAKENNTEISTGETKNKDTKNTNNMQQKTENKENDSTDKTNIKEINKNTESKNNKANETAKEVENKQNGDKNQEDSIKRDIDKQTDNKEKNEKETDDKNNNEIKQNENSNTELKENKDKELIQQNTNINESKTNNKEENIDAKIEYKENTENSKDKIS